MVDHIPPRDLPPETRSTGELIQTAFQHVNGLIRGEIALARAEAEGSLRAVAAGVGMLAVALNVLAAAIVAGLAEAGLHPGWAALIVGAFFLIAAGVLAYGGKKALEPENLAPTRTARNLRRDVETVKEATHDTR